jgi:5'-nucleotidase/UDP-sugar diphosphatase
MKKKFACRFKAAVLLFVLVLLVQGCTSSRVRVPYVLTVAHLNDTHATLEPSPLKLNIGGNMIYTNMGGFPATAAKIDSLRKEKENFLFLHAGDVFQGTLYFIKYGGMADLAFLKLMKLDAMCTGNHEFDKGPAALAAFIDAAGGQFPVLSANIDAEKEPLLNGKIKPYEIKELGSRKIGIIGLTTQETPGVSSPGPNIVFNDPVKAAKTAVAELTRQGINIIVLLSHRGFHEDIALAETIPGIDVVVGGHTHTLTGRFENIPELTPEADYPYVVKNSRKEKVLVVQAWEKDKVLGVLEVKFDSGGHVTGYSGSPLILTGDKAADYMQKNADGQKVTVDEATFNRIKNFIEGNNSIEMVSVAPGIAELLEGFSGHIRELKRTMIGQCDADLWHVREPGDIHETAGKLENGSLIAPVVADALLWKARSVKNKNTRIVIQNAGSVRCDLPKGNVTIGQVYELLPFENTLVLFDLTGAQIREVLRATIIRKDGAFPYTAGLRYSADLRRTGDDFFTTIEVRDGKNWIPLKDDDIYPVAVNSFIASGKDGYTVFETAPGSYDTGFIDAEIFMDYLKEVKTLTLSENRVTLVGK